ncbi:TPA: zinc-dependent MarR family transcriptional regulator [Streptococcus suis]|nr:zinc-dependent MarR family transcriptional regulator [Streptococcus suis]MBY5022335.1 zinc-dependent MarR family transcriptional regulator [Streptococcus suis]MCQ8265467.1 zinc-dependent MarR family transcriptional regulator [Streptococcus suis]HEL1585357.1 zinc-dependent MarR family transcriptional regulator [Streptococcus suis]HEL9645441.1 zinc-dependent MarR family transcriptional regulator [Streptococcus suis]
MRSLSKQIESSLQEIVLSSENQLEILIGTCQSQVQLTNTQEHILMLIEKNAFTSTEIAKELQVSQAAITKAVKSLLAQEMLVAVRDQKDARIIRYSLTDKAKPIAAEHAHHHAHTLSSYEELLAAYTEEEQAVISRFLEDLVGKIKK